MHTHLVILAGGSSSRMKNSMSKELTDSVVQQANQRTKGLISIDNSGRPLLDYLLHNAKLAGYEKIILVISKDNDLIKTYYGDEPKNNDFHGLSISYAIQHIPDHRNKPYGTADAVYQATLQYPELGSTPFTVCNSDNLYSAAAMRALRETEHPNAFVSYDRQALDYTAERIARFAVARLDKDNHLQDIIEKPTNDQMEKAKDIEGKSRVSMNIFKLYGTMVLPYIKECPVDPVRDEKELPTVILNLVKAHSDSVLGIAFSEHVPDLTAKEDIPKMRDYLNTHYGSLNWQQ